jgi:hypothetical protein
MTHQNKLEKLSKQQLNCKNYDIKEGRNRAQ